MDEIDALVEASLQRGQGHGSLEMCPNKCSRLWHGQKKDDCPGSHVALSDKQIDAIQSQTVLNWENFGFGL